jgi:hypothetical protein
VLGFLFVFLTARPISVRRLSLFFIFVLGLSTGMLVTLGARRAQSDALITATALTFLIWSIPPVRMLRDSIRARTMSPGGLLQVSAFVQWTYGIALAAMPLLSIAAFLIAFHHLTVGALVRLLIVAALLGLIVPVGFSSLGRSGRPRARRPQEPHSDPRFASAPSLNGSFTSLQ